MSASRVAVDLLPHRPPMRLVEELVELVPGESARGRRTTRPEDWYFQGHFPDDPVVPAIVLIELLAQTGGLAAASPNEVSNVESRMSNEKAGTSTSLRVASIGPFKFPSAARPNQLLEAHARIVGKVGGAVKIDGEVLADGHRVATGSVTLAEVRSS